MLDKIWWFTHENKLSFDRYNFSKNKRQDISSTLTWDRESDRFFGDTESLGVRMTTIKYTDSKLINQIWGDKYDVLPWSKILDLHRGTHPNIATLSKNMLDLQNYIKHEQKNTTVPDVILWVSNMTFILKRYGFDLFDLTKEQAMKSGQYKHMIENTDLPDSWIKQKKRIESGKRPIKLAIIHTEDFLKIDFDEFMKK